MAKLIGIHGKLRSGKDTLAHFLIEDHGFKRMAFADPLKAAVALLFDIDRERAFSDDKEQILESWGLTLRDVLQRFGTEAMRHTFGDSFWVQRWHAEYLRTTKPVVVTDVRFENEAATIRKLGGVIVHLRRPTNATGIASQHASEAGIALGENDIEINNDGSIDMLQHKALWLVQDIDAGASRHGWRT